MSGRLSRTVYVGNLPLDVRESEIEDIFYKYGRIVKIELKNPPRPPGFCFVEFESSRDADDAIRGRDGYKFDGNRLRVELARGGREQSSSYRRDTRDSRDIRDSRDSRDSSYRGSGGGKFPPPHKSEYRVVVKGLPSKASWQDLKDHMRKAGDVCFAQVYHDGDASMGVVHYTNYDDMKYAIRKLDDTEFRNPFGKSYIRVKMYEGGQSRSPSRSRSYSRSRSPKRSRSRSPKRSRSGSPKQSRSPRRSRSHSQSKSPRRSRSKSVGRSASPKSRSASPARS